MPLTLTWGTTTRAGPAIVVDATLVSATDTTMTLTWTADRPVQAWVEYGTTTSYGSESAHETSFSYSTHVQAISGLTAGTTYHFRVHVVDATAATALGNDVALTTTGTSGGSGVGSGVTYADYAVTAGITTISGLQSFLATVPDGADATHHSRILLGAGRTYTGSTGLVFTGRRHLTFEGGGTEVAYGHAGGAIVASTGSWGSVPSSCFYHQGTACDDIVFHALTAQGSSPTGGATNGYATTTAGQGGEYAMGFALYGARNVTIDHCVMDRNKGDGVYLAASGSQWAQNVIIRDSTIKRNGRMGLGIIASDTLTTQRVLFDDICYSPIDYEPNGTGEGARGAHLHEDDVYGDYSWDNAYGEGAIVFITGSSSATFTGSLAVRGGVVQGHNRHPSYVSKSGSMFYLHRGATKAWTLDMQHNDGAAAEAAGNYVVAMAGWTGATTIRHNDHMIAGTPALGVWVYDGGGNSGARDWQTADEA